MRPCGRQVDAADDVSVIQLGERLPAIATPTTADARGVDPICTNDPVCPLHDVTAAEALDEGRPIALLVSTPAFCQIAICEEGLTYGAGRVPTTPEALESLAASLQPTDRVAMEVSGGAWEVARILEPHVDRVVVVSPDDTGIAQARAKEKGIKLPEPRAPRGPRPSGAPAPAAGPGPAASAGTGIQRTGAARRPARANPERCAGGPANRWGTVNGDQDGRTALDPFNGGKRTRSEGISRRIGRRPSARGTGFPASPVERRAPSETGLGDDR